MTQPVGLPADLAMAEAARLAVEAGRIGGCADPIHLVGNGALVDAGTGEVLDAWDSGDRPGRRLVVACGTGVRCGARPARSCTRPTPTS